MADIQGELERLNHDTHSHHEEAIRLLELVQDSHVQYVAALIAKRSDIIRCVVRTVAIEFDVGATCNPHLQKTLRRPRRRVLFARLAAPRGIEPRFPG